MKTIYRIFKSVGLALIALWMVSCQDLLTEDPKGQLAVTNFFNSKADLDLALNGMYSKVASDMYANIWAGFESVMGDDISTHPAANKQGLREVDTYNVYASHKNSDNRNYPDSDFWLEDASFVKLKNISLTYNIPKKITKVADIQLSVSAQNLFTLTKYTGMDPEVYSESDYGFNGVDMGSYPVPRTFTFGMKLNF